MTQGHSATTPQVNTDAEIRTVAEDRLGRTPFCRRVAERIRSAGTGPSVVFGLAGPWGAGKTSVLNMVEELLKQESGDEWSVVRFTPWSTPDVSTLTDEFYMAIAGAMPRETREGRVAISRLLTMAPVAAAAGKAAAVGVIEKYLGKGTWRNVSEATTNAIADQIGKYKLAPDPFAERFDKLSAAVEQAGRNVLVVVDDIDRLHTDELLSVMKAVRLLGRFKRVHYLLSYDERTVLDVLMASQIANGEETRARQYLEKIVQYPFVLPPLQVEQTKIALTSALEAVAAVHNIPLESGGPPRLNTIARIINALPDGDMQRFTLRTTNRLASQVEVLLALVGGDDLNFTDAVLVTFLRLSYPALYAQLPRWGRDLIRLRQVYVTGLTSDRPNWVNRVGEVLNVPEMDRQDNSGVDSVVRLLSVLFPGAIQKGGMRNENETCRIDNPDYFARYFALGIPADDVKDFTVRAELAELTRTGQLPPGSAILRMLDDPLGRGRVQRKAIRQLDVITACSSVRSADAAKYLNQQLGDGDRLYGQWAYVIYALLAHAVCGADNPEDALRIMEDFAAEVGLLAMVEVLAHHLELPGIDGATVTAASKPIREAVIAACREDLTTDVKANSPEGLTILSVFLQLDDDVVSELGRIALNLISSGKAKAYQLAGRFVVITPTGPSAQRAQHFDLFEKLVPREYWNRDEIPEYIETEISVEDTSLENRIKLAAAIMRRMLSGSET